MNIQYNNWQLINISTISESFTQGVNELDDIFSGLSPYGQLITYQSNTRLEGIWDGYSFSMRGNHFVDSVPYTTTTYLGLNNSVQSANMYGYVTYNYNTDRYSGYFSKVTYSSTSPSDSLSNFEYVGKLNINGVGEVSSGIVNSYKITSDGNTLSVNGIFTVNANGDITKGNVTSFSFADNLGHSLARRRRAVRGCP